MHAGAEPNESVEADEADEEQIPPGVTTPRMAHDALFKHLFGEPHNAAAALRSVLPPEVTALFNWDTLALGGGCFSPTKPGNRGAPLARRETEVYSPYGEC